MMVFRIGLLMCALFSRKTPAALHWRETKIAWLATSPDWTLLDFFKWGFPIKYVLSVLIQSLCYTKEKTENSTTAVVIETWKKFGKIQIPESIIIYGNEVDTSRTENE